MLNLLKRNQASKKVKIKALLMRMKVYRRQMKYEDALRDAVVAMTLMDNAKQVKAAGLRR